MVSAEKAGLRQDLSHKFTLTRRQEKGRRRLPAPFRPFQPVADTHQQHPFRLGGGKRRNGLFVCHGSFPFSALSIPQIPEKGNVHNFVQNFKMLSRNQ